MSGPWPAAFRSSVEQITVVIGASLDGRKTDWLEREMIPCVRIGDLVCLRAVALTLRGLASSRILKSPSEPQTVAREARDMRESRDVDRWIYTSSRPPRQSRLAKLVDAQV